MQRPTTIGKTTGVTIALLIPLLGLVFWAAADRGELRARSETNARRNVDQDESIRQLAAAVETLRTEVANAAAWRARLETDVAYIRKAVDRLDPPARTHRTEIQP